MAIERTLAGLKRAIRGSKSARRGVRRAFIALGFDIVDTDEGARIIRIRGVDRRFYKPFFSPWLGYDETFERCFRTAARHSLLDRDRLWILYSVVRQVCGLGGEVWEAGVYRGGTALFLGTLLGEIEQGEAPTLRLFDTFEGMPETDHERDRYRTGAFRDTSEAAVRSLLRDANFVHTHKGRIPESFAPLEGSHIVFAHVDVDLYRSTLDCCEFIYPRLLAGGAIVFDDYGFPNAPGCRQAVDEFFAGRREVPLILATGQAVVHRLP